MYMEDFFEMLCLLDDQTPTHIVDEVVSKFTD